LLVAGAIHAAPARNCEPVPQDNSAAPARQVAVTTASVICRLEDNDYGGHSLNMLQRIAFVLGHRVEVRFKPIGPPRPS